MPGLEPPAYHLSSEPCPGSVTPPNSAPSLLLPSSAESDADNRRVTPSPSSQSPQRGGATASSLSQSLSPVALATDGISQALTIGGPRATTAATGPRQAARVGGVLYRSSPFPGLFAEAGAEGGPPQR